MRRAAQYKPTTTTDDRTRARVGRCRRGDNSGVARALARRTGRVGICSIWEKHEINSGNGFPGGTTAIAAGAGGGGWFISSARQHIHNPPKLL